MLIFDYFILSSESHEQTSSPEIVPGMSFFTPTPQKKLELALLVPLIFSMHLDIL